MRCSMLVALILFNSSQAQAGDVHIIDILPDQQADVFFQINTAGTVYLKIVAEKGEPCAEFWWIKWPLGTVEQLGRNCSPRLGDWLHR